LKQPVSKGKTSGEPARRFSRADWIAVGSLLLLAIVILGKVILAGGADVIGGWGTDVRLQYFAWRTFGSAQLRAGVIPLWNPHIYCGTPFLAGIQGAVFYPPSLLYLPLPTALGINYSVLLHLFLAGLFTYLFARYLGLQEIAGFMAAAAFMLSHPYLFHIYAGHLSNLATMVWTPLILLFVEMLFRTRRWWLSLVIGALLTVQLLAGHPQYFLYSCVGVGLYFIFRCVAEWRAHGARRLATLFCIMAAGVLLAILLLAAQMVPAAEFAAQSARQQMQDKVWWAGLFSLPRENLLTFFVPDFLGAGTSHDPMAFGYWGRNYIWEMSAYVGITTLLLGLVATVFRRNRHTWSLLALAAATLVLAMGKYTLVFGLLVRVPGYTMFRGSSKFIYLTALSLSLLGGYGAGVFLEGGRGVRRFARVARWVLTGIAGLTFVALLLIVDKNGARWPAWDRRVRAFVGSFQHGEAYGQMARRTRLFDNPETRERLLRESLDALKVSLGGALVIVAGVAAICFVRASKRAPNMAVCILVPAVLLGEMLYHDRGLARTGPVNQIGWTTDLVAALRQQPRPFRAWRPGGRPNDAILAGVDSVEGYDANVIGYYSAYAKITSGLLLDDPNVFSRVEVMDRASRRFRLGAIARPMLFAMNTSFVIWPERAAMRLFSSWLPRASKITSAADASHGLYRIPLRSPAAEASGGGHAAAECALPRAWIVHAKKRIDSFEHTMRRAAQLADEARRVEGLREAVQGIFAGFEASRVVLLSRGSVVAAATPAVPEADPVYKKYTAHRSAIQAAPAAPGWLVISDAYYPGWKAYRKGARVELLRANHAFRAVELPEAGEAVIDMVYDPPSFKLGVAFSLAALGVAVALGTVAVARRRKGIA